MNVHCRFSRFCGRAFSAPSLAGKRGARHPRMNGAGRTQWRPHRGGDNGLNALASEMGRASAIPIWGGSKGPMHAQGAGQGAGQGALRHRMPWDSGGAGRDRPGACTSGSPMCAFAHPGTGLQCWHHRRTQSTRQPRRRARGGARAQRTGHSSHRQGDATGGKGRPGPHAYGWRPPPEGSERPRRLPRGGEQAKLPELGYVEGSVDIGCRKSLGVVRGLAS